MYVQDFYAHRELQTMIGRMEQRFGTKNIVNKYINDNLLRIQLGVKRGKAPEALERVVQGDDGRFGL